MIPTIKDVAEKNDKWSDDFRSDLHKKVNYLILDIGQKLKEYQGVNYQPPSCPKKHK